MDNINILAIISVAFFGSLGHCIGMCGGFVVAYTSAKINPKKHALKQLFLHIIYNLGRVSS
ncbi:MAG: sulfite exporter TauE/SafE family protein, partial [Sulfurospirillaceae bacterium]